MSLVRGVRRAVDHTPEDRNRHVDLLRAFAISTVVIGHWLAVVATTDDGLDGSNALSHLSWAHPLTWVLQVMPVFFLVGGYANGASLASHYRRNGDRAGWLLGRSARLLRPTTTFLVLLAAVGLGTRALGGDPQQVAMGVWAASIPLWFLAAYSSLVFLAPFLHDVHRRLGLAFPAAVGVVVLLLDVARLQLDVPGIGYGNHLLVWLVLHQLGFAWQDGSLGLRPALYGVLAILGVGLLVAITAFGPYPVSMVGVPGADVQNTAPPTFALLVLGLVQAAVALLLSGPLNRFLQRTRPWTAVVAVNSVILTMFLWHMGAAVLSVVALYPTGIMPQPAVDSGEWLLLRLPWLAFCAVVLALLVSVFAPLEARSTGVPKGQQVGATRSAVPGAGPVARLRIPARAWRAMIALGVAGVVGGLVIIANADRDYEGLVGLPTGALIFYLLGAALLRLARRQQPSNQVT